MRILNKRDFLKQPAGIVYCYSNEGIVGFHCCPIRIKGDTCKKCINPEEEPSDWFEVYLNEFENTDSEDYCCKYSEMLEEHKSYPLMEEISGRNGLFDEDDTFLVYEKNDLDLLIKMLQNAKPYVEIKEEKNMTNEQKVFKQLREISKYINLRSVNCDMPDMSILPWLAFPENFKVQVLPNCGKLLRFNVSKKNVTDPRYICANGIIVNVFLEAEDEKMFDGEPYWCMWSPRENKFKYNKMYETEALFAAVHNEIEYKDEASEKRIAEQQTVAQEQSKKIREQHLSDLIEKGRTFFESTPIVADIEKVLNYVEYYMKLNGVFCAGSVGLISILDGLDNLLYLLGQLPIADNKDLLYKLLQRIHDLEYIFTETR